MNIKRAFLLLIMFSAFVSLNAQKRPNIIYIMSDDHAYQAISAYGSTRNETPNIDRIADEGVRFDRSYVTNSICGPSRACLMTGKYSHSNGYLMNNLMYTDTIGIAFFNQNQTTLPKVMKENGYKTAIVGKWHLGTTPEGFDYSDVVPSQGDYYNPQFIHDGDTAIVPGYVTNIITDKAIDWIDGQKDGEEPFMLFLHHKAPHRNWIPELSKLEEFPEEYGIPENFNDTYEGRVAAQQQDLSIDKTMTWGHDLKFKENPAAYENPDLFKSLMDMLYVKNDLARFTPEQREAWLKYYEPRNAQFKKDLDAGNLTPQQIKEWKYYRYMHDYLATISSVDDGVGEVLDYLKENGLDENTIVVYTSDQGFYLGEHGWFDKRLMYEESFRTPLLIKYPDHIPAGSVNNDFVLNIDHFSTFLDYAGIKTKEKVDGKSYRKIAEGKADKKWRDAVYYHYYEYPSVHSIKRHYGLRTDRYKLIHFYHDVDTWEFFDLEKDPSEMNNLINDPAYQKEIADMQKRLVKEQKKVGDSYELAKKYINEQAPLGTMRFFNMKEMMKGH